MSSVEDSRGGGFDVRAKDTGVEVGARGREALKGGAAARALAAARVVRRPLSICDGEFALASASSERPGTEERDEGPEDGEGRAARGRRLYGVEGVCVCVRGVLPPSRSEQPLRDLDGPGAASDSAGRLRAGRVRLNMAVAVAGGEGGREQAGGGGGAVEERSKGPRKGRGSSGGHRRQTGGSPGGGTRKKQGRGGEEKANAAVR